MIGNPHRVKGVVGHLPRRPSFISLEYPLGTYEARPAERFGKSGAEKRRRRKGGGAGGPGAGGIMADRRSKSRRGYLRP